MFPARQKRVYFVRPVGMSGPVKIGWTSYPDSRLQQLLGLSPFALEIVASMPGDGALERRFHAYVAEHRSHHEWFHAAPKVVAMVEALAAGTFDMALLPARGCSSRRTTGQGLPHGAPVPA